MGWLERLKLPPVPAIRAQAKPRVSAGEKLERKLQDINDRLSNIGKDVEDYFRRIKDALGAFTLEGLADGAEADDVTFPATPHNLLSSTHSDTAAATVSRGSLVVGTEDSLWEELPIGSANRVLFSDGVDAAWDQVNTASIEDDAVTYAKMQNVSAASLLLGRGSAAGGGDAQEITLGTNLSMSGTTLNASGGGGSDNDAQILAYLALAATE